MRWQKKRPGDALRIPASLYNALLDLLNTRDNFSRSATKPIRDTVKIRNMTGQPVPRLGILAIGAPLILPTANLDEFINRPAFTGHAPSDNAPFAITAEPLAPGAIGEAILAGITPARINVTLPTATTAGPSSDPTALVTTPNGPAQILWRESGDTGTKWAIVSIGPRTQPVIRFQLINALAPGGAATAYILDPAGHTTTTVAVFDGLGIFTGTGGKRGYAAWLPDAGRYEIIQLEC